MREKKRMYQGFAALIFVLCAIVVLFGTTKMENKDRSGSGERAAETAKEIPDGPGQLYAQSAVLIDADSGRILFGKNETEVRPMASTTKIMTCILTLENMKEGQIADVSDRAAGQPKVRLGVQKGERYYVKDLLYSLMLESHNDSAVVIAEAIGGSVEGFAEMMNEKAAAIGCADTHFVTPNGLDASDGEGAHATTSADLARIMRYCIMESPKREEFLAVTRTENCQFADVDKKRSFSCSNHNAFLGMMDGALTGKTGFTGDAGYCYVGALRRDERTFIVALLACGWPNNKGYKWKDTRKLMEYAVGNYRYQSAGSAMEDIEVPVRGGADPDDGYSLDCRITAGMRQEDREELENFRVLVKDGEHVISEQKSASALSAPVRAGERVGSYVLTLNGEEVKSYDIVALESAQKRDVRWCFLRMLGRILL